MSRRNVLFVMTTLAVIYAFKLKLCQYSPKWRPYKVKVFALLSPTFFHFNPWVLYTGHRRHIEKHAESVLKTAPTISTCLHLVLDAQQGRSTFTTTCECWLLVGEHTHFACRPLSAFDVPRWHHWYHFSTRHWRLSRWHLREYIQRSGRISAASESFNALAASKPPWRFSDGELNFSDESTIWKWRVCPPHGGDRQEVNK